MFRAAAMLLHLQIKKKWIFMVQKIKSHKLYSYYSVTKITEPRTRWVEIRSTNGDKICLQKF